MSSNILLVRLMDSDMLDLGISSKNLTTVYEAARAKSTKPSRFPCLAPWLVSAAEAASEGRRLTHKLHAPRIAIVTPTQTRRVVFERNETSGASASVGFDAK